MIKCKSCQGKGYKFIHQKTAKGKLCEICKGEGKLMITQVQRRIIERLEEGEVIWIAGKMKDKNFRIGFPDCGCQCNKDVNDPVSYMTIEALIKKKLIIPSEWWLNKEE